jgi:hypothetical protein
MGGACTPEKKETPPPAAVPSPSVSPSASPAVSPSASPSGSPAAAKVESWAGKWKGVEGTYLTISKKEGEKYSIEIANLDGPKTYEGTGKGDHIEFTRNGKTETVRAATGAETGMKYLEKEKNCLVVTKGSEGFCR